MSLASLIRKRPIRGFATATVATFATHAVPDCLTVASVAIGSGSNGVAKTPTVATVASVATGIALSPDLPTVAEVGEEMPAPESSSEPVSPRPDGWRPLWMTADLDDRRTCGQCQQYQFGVCSIAWPGGVVSANRDYRPPPDRLQRCAGYLPKPHDPDQRPGTERWNLN